MLSWARPHRIGIAGVAACLIFGGVEALVFAIAGLKSTDLGTPAGVLATAIAGLFAEPPSATHAGSAHAELVQRLMVGWQTLLTLLFAALFWLRTRIAPGRHRNHLLALQMVLGAASASALLYVLAAELARLFPLRRGLKWLGAQMLLLAGVLVFMALARRSQLSDINASLIFIYGAFGLLFHVLAFGMATIAVRERQARLALAAAHARLLATQSILADTVRSSERARIGRDLHDAIGHHLTALNLHLDLALRQSRQAAPASLHTSRELAHSLLSEVRQVVSTERETQHIDVRAAIATMCAGIPQPAISLHYDQALMIDSPLLAHTLFFCVQEAVTNAVRHAGAAHLEIEVTRTGQQLSLRVQDDGAGSDVLIEQPLEGNGLRGMRERVDALGGSMTARGLDENGFRLDVVLPLQGVRP